MIRALRYTAVGILILLAIAAAVSLAFPISASTQFRDAIDRPPSAAHPLGTDDLGRDRLARVLCGLRLSFLLAPAAAVLSTMLAALIGGLAGWHGGIVERLSMAAADLFVSLPWLFLLITVRAVLPLNVSPLVSIAVTFLLLGVLGWAAPARVVRARVRVIARSDYLLQARAAGASPARLFLRQLVPNLGPVLAAQFWIAVPVYIIAEANLGLLGLGVSDPLVSLGGMVRELENEASFFSRPWILAPAVVLVLAIASVHFARMAREES